MIKAYRKPYSILALFGLIFFVTNCAAPYPSNVRKHQANLGPMMAYRSSKADAHKMAEEIFTDLAIKKTEGSLDDGYVRGEYTFPGTEAKETVTLYFDEEIYDRRVMRMTSETIYEEPSF